MRKNDYINLLIVSNQAGIKTYFISYKRFILYSVLCMLLFLLVIGSATLLNYSLKLNKLEHSSLRNELHKEILEVEHEMEVMIRYMDKINLMVEYDFVITNNRKPGKYGVGGGDDLAIDEMNYPSGGEKVDNFINKKKNIFVRIENLEDDLDDLVLNLQNMVDRLNSTPSILPVKGIITSGFGYRKSPFTGRRELHRGIDILNEVGTPVISPADGIIKEISTNTLWGNNILIFHLDDLETQYGHLDEIIVEIGQKIKRGDIIGTLGYSGRITGPHLHYQVWVKGSPVDPMDYVIEENLESIN